MNKYTFKIIITCIFLISLFGCSTLITNVRKNTDDTNLIYSIFCNYFVEKLTENEITTFVLIKKTGFDENMDEFKNDEETIKRFLLFMPALNKSTFNNLLEVNNKSSSIVPFYTKKRLAILSYEEKEEIFKSKGWDGFYEK